MSDFDETETWAAALTLAQLSAQGDPAYGVDRAVIADFEGRTIIEFEGAQNQLNIFDGLAEEDQRALLEGVIAETNEPGDQQTRLRNAWLTGDATILEETTKTGIMTDPELREALLVERNEDWVDTLSALLKDPERPLVAVGAAHLVGPESLPALLEQQGYSIEPMTQ
ncbi:MAG: TraB/GumN family protein, partial [Pseudomonadota bacterium]